jgi:magnesium transporter
MFAGIIGDVTDLPGMTPEDERCFRDLTGAMDTHLSTVSNRLNVVMKQLTIIAAVFLPLSFLTGLFGQNFSLLVNHVVDSAWAFWVLGIGLELLAVSVLLDLFRGRGWLGGPTT